MHISSKGIGGYIVSVLNGMAQGLFSSLIIGLIIKQIGTYASIDFLVSAGSFAQAMTCPAIGVGVARAVGAPNLALFAAATAGVIGGGAITDGAIISGEPLGACIASLAGALCGKAIAGKTKVDIILVPMITIVAGGIAGMIVSPAVAALMNGLGAFINHLTTLYPLPMGILVSVRARSRCRMRRMRCADGWLCSDELQGEWGRRAYKPGNRNLDAADSEYLEELEDLDTAYNSFGHNWPCLDMHIQDDEQCLGCRHGHKRACRAVQCRC